MIGMVAVAGCAHRSPPAPSPPPTGAVPCGEERWAVKTLSDPEATRVDFANVIRTSVSALNDLTPHCSNLPEPRTFPEEFRVYEVPGVVTLARQEDDQDIHLVLADPQHPSRTIVTEVVDPSCSGVAQSPYLSILTQARSAYQALSPLAGKNVMVRGVGFYDFAHGQAGRSVSCIELHPVTRLTLAP
jgi:hypothetical protein